MKESVGIYVRHSGVGTFLNIHVPGDRKEEISQISCRGEKDREDVFLELHVLSEWITDEEVRSKVTRLNECIHLRIPIAFVNFIVSD